MKRPKKLTPTDRKRSLLSSLTNSIRASATAAAAIDLPSFIEPQVHGFLLLLRTREALIFAAEDKVLIFWLQPGQAKANVNAALRQVFCPQKWIN